MADLVDVDKQQAISTTPSHPDRSDDDADSIVGKGGIVLQLVPDNAKAHVFLSPELSIKPRTLVDKMDTTCPPPPPIDQPSRSFENATETFSCSNGSSLSTPSDHTEPLQPNSSPEYQDDQSKSNQCLHVSPTRPTLLPEHRKDSLVLYRERKSWSSSRSSRRRRSSSSSIGSISLPSMLKGYSLDDDDDDDVSMKNRDPRNISNNSSLASF